MFLDLIYLAVLAALSPWLLWRATRTGRYRRHTLAKLTGRVAIRPDGRPTAWFHAVSVGEVHLLGPLVAGFRRDHPGWRVVVSSTTDTGLSEAQSRFPDLAVVPWPFDFSWAVSNALDTIRPDLVVLAEAELWPNFLRAAERRRIPVAVVNARMSPRSFARLRRLGRLADRHLYGRVRLIAAQSADYADRFRLLGVPADRLRVTGSVKYDGAAGDRDTPRARALRTLLGIEADGPPVLVAGSTHAPEEAIVLDAFHRLRERFPELRLILVPRHPDRFEEVAALAEASGLPFVRRSQLLQPLPEPPAVLLLDTVGELGAAWGLADVGYVGGTLDGRRGGQSMIEPAGYGVPTVFGPHVWNFRDAANRLVEAGGAIMVREPGQVADALAQLLADDRLRAETGSAARRLVREQQGATRRTLDALNELAGRAAVGRAA